MSSALCNIYIAQVLGSRISESCPGAWYRIDVSHRSCTIPNSKTLTQKSFSRSRPTHPQSTAPCMHLALEPKIKFIIRFKYIWDWNPWAWDQIWALYFLKMRQVCSWADWGTACYIWGFQEAHQFPKLRRKLHAGHWWKKFLFCSWWMRECCRHEECSWRTYHWSRGETFRHSQWGQTFCPCQAWASSKHQY